MGYGQNYSVSKNSDIDLIVVADISQIDKLNEKPYFKNQISQEVLKMWKNKGINCFWISRNIEGIKVNVFIYESENYKNFCLLKGSFTAFTNSKPENTKLIYDFEGNEIKIDIKVKHSKIGHGFIYTKPALSNGKFIGVYPTMDFIESCQILYEKNNFLINLQKDIWKNIANQLILEHGKNVNLAKFNILNAHWVYQNHPEKLPQKIINQIQEKTKSILDSLK